MATLNKWKVGFEISIFWGARWRRKLGWIQRNQSRLHFLPPRARGRSLQEKSTCYDGPQFDRIL